MSRRARPHCTCAVVQAYDYDEAAAKLRCKPRFLRDHIKALPHMRLGESVSFCECDLRAVQDMFTAEVPANVRQLVPVAPSADEQASTARLRSIRPSGARKRATR